MDLIELVKAKLIEYEKSNVQRINHSLKVHSLAKFIGEGEGLEDDIMTTVEIAALLHDIGNDAVNKTEKNCQDQEVNTCEESIADDLIKNLEIDNSNRERIKYLILHHHKCCECEALDCQILAEADALVCIFEDKISKDKIKDLEEHLFRTETGCSLLESMYL